MLRKRGSALWSVAPEQTSRAKQPGAKAKVAPAGKRVRAGEEPTLTLRTLKFSKSRPAVTRGTPETQRPSAMLEPFASMLLFLQGDFLETERQQRCRERLLLDGEREIRA